jgi:hypothetical protein
MRSILNKKYWKVLCNRTMIHNLKVLKKKFSILEFQADSVLPDWIYLSDFYSITKTQEELSVVTSQPDSFNENIKCSKDWRVLKIIGPLDFSLIGVIADISNILKDARVPIFTISTYNTDYILVRQKDLDVTIKALRDKNYNIMID